MNDLQFDTILKALAEELDRKDQSIAGLENVVADLRYDLDRHPDLKDLDYYKKKVGELLEENGLLRQELIPYRSASSALKDQASNYMEETGQHIVYTELAPYVLKDQIGQPNKIGMIKGVRELTKWGLKESKDFVNAWLEAHPKTPVQIGEHPYHDPPIRGGWCRD